MPNNKNRIHQVVVLFFIAILLSVIGLSLRNFQSLSIFWPGNAVLLGLLIRFPVLDNRVSLLALFSGMLVTDLCWGTPPMISVGVNVANVTFIAAARWVLLTRHFTRPYSRRLQSLIRVFPASIAGAAVCAAFGGLVSERYFHDDLFKAWFSWFSEQMSTSILLLPAVISLPRYDELRPMLRKTCESSLLPMMSLLVTFALSIWVGGGSSLLFPLPALLWCAVSYPLFIVCLLTLITGISEIILVASHVLNIQGENDLFRIDSLSAARLGVAAMTISPLIVSISIEFNKKLVARLTHRADYDLLTGALTRSGLSSHLQALLTSRNRPPGFSGALFLVDIDHFKNINDSWGHAAGDCVLAQTVQIIQQALPPDSLVCRMGGEEFLILLESTNEARAFLLANRLRNSIESNTIMHNGKDLSVTASIGISLLTISSVQALEEAINRADEQLYLAKKSGRNQVRPQFVL
ncbi:diguanylate cyclase domain-containing protein [Erwiniaceae bacterium CAU 1747]